MPEPDLLADPRLARRVVENLRSGVPSPVVASHFPMGREALLGRIGRDLGRLGSEPVTGFLLQANYGEGKTHVLHAVLDGALRQNCAVSMVCLSRETRLDQPERLYAKLATDLRVPGSSQPGLDRLLGQFEPGEEKTQRLLAWVEEHLHPKIGAVLRNRLEGNLAYGEEVHRLDRDLLGTFMDLQDLRAIHRLNFRQPLRLARPFRPRQDAFDYFRFAERLIAVAGLRGWVILLDELELLAYFGPGTRALSCAFLPRIFGLTGQLGRTYALGVVASSFLSEAFAARDDATLLPAWLRQRGRSDEAELAERGIALLRAAEVLPALGPDQLLAVFRQILQAHQAAYRWTSGLDAERLARVVEDTLAGKDPKLRTKIRCAIQILDFEMQYGVLPDRMAVGTLEEMPARAPAEETEEP
jgi:hypothetical protein